MLRFAARDLALHPLRTLLIGMAVSVFTFVTASALTFAEAVSHSANERILEQPAVVVRKSDGTPMPIDDALKRLRKIPGVLGAWPRIHDRIGRLPDGEADDISLNVFHPSEAEAMLPEIQAALPWPVEIVTRESRSTYLKGRISHRSGLWLLLFVPSALALVYLLAASLQTGAGEMRAIGIQKAVGWQSADIIRNSLYRATLLGVPAAVIGGIAASGVVAVSDAPSIRLFLLGAEGGDFPMSLTVSGAIQSVLVSFIMVLVPVYIGAVIPTAKALLTDPGMLLRQGGR